MASPQIENGYTRIANELYEKIYSTSFLASEFRIILCILRKTYGWNKKEDRISLSQFVRETRLSKQTVVTALKTLISNNIIIRKNFVYSIKKDYTKWGSQTDLTSQTHLTRTSQTHLTFTSQTDLTHKRQLKTIKDNTDSKESGAIKKNMKTLNYETGEYEEEKPKSNKREDIIKLAKLFDEMARDYSKKPITTSGSYFIVQKAMKTHGLKPKGIIKLYQDWFNDPKIEMENKINMTWCLGKVNINKFKLKN